MKKNLIYPCLLLAMVLILAACQPEPDEPQKQQGYPEAVIIQKLQAAGFDTSEGFSRYKNGYLVEYDIFLTEKQIDDLSESQPVDGGKGGSVKHYRTNNLVAGNQRIIRVSMGPGFTGLTHAALDEALRRYNELPLALHFVRVPYSKTADIRITGENVPNGLVGATNGYPVNGNPASEIELNTWYLNKPVEWVNVNVPTLITHNIGQCLGFRHTDWMNTRFSNCPNSMPINQGAEPHGAVHIPGTPTGPEERSWMLACQGFREDRPFTPSDRVALMNTYPKYPIQIRSILEASEELRVGQGLRSPDGRFRAVLQDDGNFVIYNNSTDKPVWASNTAGKRQITRCVMQADGNLVLYDNSGKPYWASNTSQPGSFLALQNEGVLAIYQSNGRINWASNILYRFQNSIATLNE